MHNPSILSRVHVFLWKKLKHSVVIKLLIYRVLWLFPLTIRKPDEVWKELHALDEIKSSITCMNIGANDGLAGDPLAEFIFTRNWSGVLVEPVPYVFERLRNVYAGVERVVCINAAIADKSTTMPFYYLEKTSDLPPGYDQIGSFDKKHVLKHEHMFPGCGKYMISKEIECLSLKDLMKKTHVKHVDVLLIDTEGFDWFILQQLDHMPKLPTVVIYEEDHMDSITKEAALRFMKKHGYSLTPVVGNIIAKRPID